MSEDFEPNYSQGRAIKICPECGSQNTNSSNYCTSCGARLPCGRCYCPDCGTTYNGDIKYCSRCGEPTIPGAPQQKQEYHGNLPQGTRSFVSSKDWITALLLAVFLGWMGAHRFYVGKVGTGIIWLLSSGLFVIGWLVDVIMILCGRFRDKYGLLLSRK